MSVNELAAGRFIEETLADLLAGLQPFVTSRIAEVAPVLTDWTELLQRKDRQAGRNFDRYNPRDLSLVLRMLTENLGTLGYPFSGHLNRQATNCASELRNVRNKWAHNEDFTPAETYRALDSAEILLTATHATAQADAVTARKREVLAFLASPSSATVPLGEEPIPETTTSRSMTESQDERRSDDATQTTISISALPVLSYAHALADVPVVDEITVTHIGRELRGASVEIEAQCHFGSLGDPKVIIADLNGRAPTTLRNIGLMLDPSRMMVVESPTKGSVHVTLRSQSGEIIAEAHSEVEVLAANQWVANPLQLSLELLAAFVQPNSPVVPELLLEASDHLAQSTGSSALDGYQQGSRERVDAIVEAVYESIRARDIRYAEPPASWGLEGQKVRTPHEVLVGRLGTCLDTTLTMAAVLEEAGINSTLWLLEGHIFLGYWRDDASLDGPAQTDVSEVINYVGLGQIGVVETTMLTGGAGAMPFADAVRAPHRSTLAGDLSTLLGVTDVKQARLARIYPLPSRSVSETGEVSIHEYRVAAAPDALHYAPPEAQETIEAARRIPPRIAQWKNALLDLSLRNRLINFGEKSGYSLAVPQPSVPLLEDIVNGGSAVTLVPSDRIPQVERGRGIRFAQDLPEQARAAMLTERKQAFIAVTEATYKTRLQALAYKARTILEETGANNLYLAFGMLRWTFNDRELRSPLVLVPVHLESSGRGSVFRLTIDDAGESTPNYCLLEKLRVSFGLEIPGLAVPAKDDAGIDLPAAFAATRRALTSAHLSFVVEDTVDLAILQFAKFRLWKDLDENWEELATNPLVSHLIHSPTAAFDEPAASSEPTDLDALGNAVPMPADSSQLDAVAAATSGQTFVLEGPPGTGKSQTITNLLADALSNGKRVLFVAEKRAALDVVRERLDGIGLGPFSLNLHDKSARPNAVRAQIKAALEATIRADEAGLRASLETAETSRGSLRRYAERLHSTNPAGLSLYSARAHLLAAPDDVAALDVPTAFVAETSPDRLEHVRSVLRQLPETADLAHPAPQHPWGFLSCEPAAAWDIPSLHNAAQEFDRSLQEVRAAGADVDTLLSIMRTPAALGHWASIAKAPRYDLGSLDALRPRAIGGEVRGLLHHIAAMSSSVPPWAATVGVAALEGDVRGIYADAVAAEASGLFGRKKRQRAALARYGDALQVEARRFNAKLITTLTADLARTADEVEQLRSQLAALPIPAAGPTWNPYLRDDAQRATGTLEWGEWLTGALREGDALQDRLRRHYVTHPQDLQLSESLSRLANAWRALADAAGIAEANIGDGDPMTRWAESECFLDAWQTTRLLRAVDASTPVTLQRWVDFVRTLEPLRQGGMETARDSLLTGRVAADVATLAFDKGIATASIAERESSQALADFDVPAHNRAITRFTSSATQIRKELPASIPARIIRQRRIDPGYESGMMGELKRQINRQRGGMTVRALFEKYGELITQIAPCVLMSPESVARFFPARSGMFDIVVFDEASQIRVADAVGAMGRGRSVVVVGDSKQMPPTSFAEVNTDADSELDNSSDIVVDEESILTECVQARVPRKWLSWHYRSQDESLIAFSNHAYYESRLSSFPAPWRNGAGSAHIIDPDHGVSLVRVDGHFNRVGRGRDLRTNMVEAAAIVDEVKRRFAASPDHSPSLGIITFNAQQRTLIETLLRESDDERLGNALDEHDGLFVKNLENVQGDERDVILFSVAFSANDRGVVPLNFGPLSRAGGERRLNVAITRARRQVTLFASFDPSELRAEQTASLGIKHLKAYLELAASGEESSTDDQHRARIIDRHRDEIAEALRARGYGVRTDVGMSDFRVDVAVALQDSPEQPVLAILLDGENWRERRTVADRDGLPIDVLQGLMHWPGVERVWLPEWLQHRDETIKRLEGAIVAAGDAFNARQLTTPLMREATAATTSAATVSASPLVPHETPSVSTADLHDHPKSEPLAPAVFKQLSTPSTAPASALRHPHLHPFTAWGTTIYGTVKDLDQLPSPRAVEKVRNVMRNIIQAEGPVHKTRLVKLVAESFGLSKVHAARSEAILRHLPTEFVRKSDRSCAWPTSIDPDGWRVARQSSPGDGRNLDHVALEEIANAMAIVAELSGGMGREEIKREALGVFGGKRMTEGISSRLDKAIERGVKTGRIERDSRGLFVATPPKLLA